MGTDAKGGSERGKALSQKALADAFQSLLQLPPIAGLNKESISLLQNGLRIRNYRAGALILRCGEPGDSCFIVIRGVVSARRVDSKGKELRYGSMGPGAIFGELAILTQDTRGTDVIAEQAATIAELPAQSFRDLLAASPEFSIYVLTSLANRFRSNTERLSDLSFLDLNQRLLLMLSRMATCVELDKTSTLLVRELPPRQHLASLLSCSREAVSRSLRQLEKQGSIVLRGNQVEILADISTMRQLSNP